MCTKSVCFRHLESDLMYVKINVVLKIVTFSQYFFILKIHNLNCSFLNIPTKKTFIIYFKLYV